jgi:hypothetical protein
MRDAGGRGKGIQLHLPATRTLHPASSSAARLSASAVKPYTLDGFTTFARPAADSSPRDKTYTTQIKMEKQEAKSKWDELVRQLGAEVTPEIEQLVEAGPAPPAEPVSYSIRSLSEEGVEQAPTVPKRPAAGWDNLASEFGLPSPPEPEAPAAEETVAVTKKTPGPRAASADRPRREPPDQDRRDRHDKRRESRDESREPSHQRREPPDRRRKSSKFRERNEGREEKGEVAEASQTAREVPPPPRQVREEPKREAVEERPKPGPAVSLWHKIFGSPADQSAKLEEISTRPDDESTTREVDDEQPLARDTEIDADRAVDDQLETHARDEFDRGTEPELESEQPEEGERRPRRSRRRRRGRGGKSESGFDGGHRAARSQSRSDEPQDDGDDLNDLADGSDEIGFDASQDESEGDVIDTEDVEGDENGNQRIGRSRAALQRSIPSWDEAIGFIVDANMQSRSQRRPSGPSGSRSGSPRGRSRGRRRN